MYSMSDQWLLALIIFLLFVSQVITKIVLLNTNKAVFLAKDLFKFGNCQRI